MIYADIDSIPKCFRFCLNDNCPVASTCLHHEAGILVMDKGVKSITVFNPKLMAGRDENCKDFVSTRIISYSTGLFRFFNKVPAGEVRKVRDALIDGIGSERQFYRVRKGEVSLGPEASEKCRNKVAETGCKIPLFFDKNVDMYAFK